MTAYCLSAKSGQDKTLLSIQINKVGLHRLSSDITYHTIQIVARHKSAQRQVEIGQGKFSTLILQWPTQLSDCELSWQAGGSMPAVTDTTI